MGRPVARLALCGCGKAPPGDAAQPGRAHQPRYALAGHGRALGLQFGVHPRRAVGAVRGGVDRADPAQQRRIPSVMGRRRAVPPHVVAGRRDALHIGHGGDREIGLVRAHELEDPLGVLSLANQVAAFAKMSRSWRERWFSRRSFVNSSRSTLVTPSSLRRPPSRSAWRTQFQIDWAVGSNSRESSSGVRPDRTNSTICRRNSGG